MSEDTDVENLKWLKATVVGRIAVRAAEIFDQFKVEQDQKNGPYSILDATVDDIICDVVDEIKKEVE